MTVKSTYITCLPLFDNNGRSTLRSREIFYASLRASGVHFQTKPARGLWYADDGTLHAEPIEHVLMVGSSKAMETALRVFGSAESQLAMLFVQHSFDGAHIVGLGAGEEEASNLAAAHGGATLFTETNVAVSYRYEALEAGVHYELGTPRKS